MKKETVYALGLLMVLAGVLSTLHFVFYLQGFFKVYLNRYGHLFNKGLLGRCLFLDILMFLYISSILFKNFYYVIGGILILCFVEFGRELGLFASLIGLITEVSFCLVRFLVPDPSSQAPTVVNTFFFFCIGVAIPLIFIYFLTQKTTVQYLKNRENPQGKLPRPSL